MFILCLFYNMPWCTTVLMCTCAQKCKVMIWGITMYVYRCTKLMTARSYFFRFSHCQEILYRARWNDYQVPIWDIWTKRERGLSSHGDVFFCFFSYSQTIYSGFFFLHDIYSFLVMAYNWTPHSLAKHILLSYKHILLSYKHMLTYKMLVL